jgi:hypothetical protein
MTRADVERKFRSNVGKNWSKAQADAMLAKLWALDLVDDLPSLLRELVVRKQ